MTFLRVVQNNVKTGEVNVMFGFFKSEKKEKLKEEIKNLEQEYVRAKEEHEYRNMLAEAHMCLFDDGIIEKSFRLSNLPELKDNPELKNKWENTFFYNNRKIAEMDHPLISEYDGTEREIRVWYNISKKNLDKISLEEVRTNAFGIPVSRLDRLFLVYCKAAIPTASGFPKLLLENPFGTVMTTPCKELPLYQANELIGRILYAKLFLDGTTTQNEYPLRGYYLLPYNIQGKKVDNCPTMYFPLNTSKAGYLN